MNNALFRMSIDESVSICKTCGLFKDHIASNEERTVIMGEIRNLDEYKSYIESIQNKGEYDILLADDSVFLFDKAEKELMDEKKKRIKYHYYKYSFIQSPSRRQTFKEYCDGIDTDAPDFNEEFFREMYEADNPHVDNNFPFYLRYDVDLKGYLPNSHSYAHLHIGLHTGYRLPASLILTPKAFVCMVLKLVYPDNWETEVVLNSRVKANIYNALKSQCQDDKNPFWTSDESKDMYLG